MADRPRARELGIVIGGHEPGPLNAITDVPGVQVGHTTIQRPPDVHTGVTAIVPADVSPLSPLPAGLFAGNGYGKLVGATQLDELGQLETPIVLTATLSAFRVADAVVDWMLARPDCADIVSLNPVVGECNDGYLSDIRSRPIDRSHVLSAIEGAAGGPVAEGCVGAGTGTGALGFKAGIGTSSRVLTLAGATATVGVLAQANFGGTLRVHGRHPSPESVDVQGDPSSSDDGSCMLVVATNAPLDARQLRRVARRAVFGLGRVGASYSNGSGDYGIAFATRTARPIPDAALSLLFEATLDIVEEAILHSLLAATTTTGRLGRTLQAIPPAALRNPG